jgi:hypothetical protein
MAMSGPGPWAPASETFNKFARMDPHLASQLNDLGKHQAYETKLATAIESGRVYGLRTQALAMMHKKELHFDMRYPPTQRMWRVQ